MQHLEIHLSPAANFRQTEAALEAALAAAGLQITLRGTLGKFPGCIHWHAQEPGKPGTLELTLWPQEKRAWFSIQRGRTAGWITQRLPEIRAIFGRHLAAAPET